MASGSVLVDVAMDEAAGAGRGLGMEPRWERGAWNRRSPAVQDHGQRTVAVTAHGDNDAPDHKPIAAARPPKCGGRPTGAGLARQGGRRLQCRLARPIPGSVSTDIGWDTR